MATWQLALADGTSTFLRGGPTKGVRAARRAVNLLFVEWLQLKLQTPLPAGEAPVAGAVRKSHKVGRASAVSVGGAGSELGASDTSGATAVGDDGLNAAALSTPG